MPAQWFYEQEAYDLLDTIAASGARDGLVGAEWIARIRACLADGRQVVINETTGVVVASPSRCKRPNILVLSQWSDVKPDPPARRTWTEMIEALEAEIGESFDPFDRPKCS